MNPARSNSPSTNLSASDPFPLPDFGAEKIVFWTIALVPLWWILGLQVAVYPLVGWYLFYRSWQRPVRITYLFGWNMWWVYIGVWILSLIVNLGRETSEVGRSTTNLGSIIGVWCLAVILWYAMRRLGVRYHVVVRAIAILGVCQLVAVVLGEGYHLATGSILKTQSLIVSVIPSVPAKVFFEAKLYGLADVGWDVDAVPRLKSFYYWSPIAGTVSIFVTMAALCETNYRLKILALLGGLTTIWFAEARAAQIGVAVALCIALFLGSAIARRVMFLSIPFVLGLAPVIQEELHKYLFERRSGSAAARIALYSETYAAFMNSPLIGYGAHGRSKFLEIPLGSHSQVLSTIYKTGVLGAGVLIVAWIALTVDIFRLVRILPVLSPLLGAWIGLTMVMPSGELEAASVTVFIMGSWFGCAWNYYDDQMNLRQNYL